MEIRADPGEFRRSRCVHRALIFPYPINSYEDIHFRRGAIAAAGAGGAAETRARRQAAAEEVETSLSELSRRIDLSGGMRVDIAGVAKQRAEMETHLDRVRESIAEIDSIGVQVKDLESGLLDFPFKLEDKVVLLCWRMGEPAIEHWHTVESGFNGRKPVDERFKRRPSGQKPN